jgi:hypothetical protein
MDAALLALTPLPVEGQLTLLRMDAPDVHTALATSPYLDPTAARVLHDKVVVAPSAVWYTIRYLTDTELLTSYVFKGSIGRATAAARNQLTPAAALEAALGSPHPAVRLAALVNPSTPVELRRQAGTPEVLAELVNVGSNLADSVVRAAEVVLNNPWIGEDPGRYDKMLHRAIACSPFSTAESVASLPKFSRSGRIFVKRHPLLLEPGATWESFTTEELVAFAHPASDLVVLQRPDLDSRTAAAMLPRSENEVEPQVLARLLFRFSLSATAWYQEHRFSGSRIGAAAWSHPVAQHLSSWSPEKFENYRTYVEALPALGSTKEVWEMFGSMLQNWSLEPAKLVSTVHRLLAASR